MGTGPDDPRWEPGMPVLDRQPIGVERPRDRIAETKPTPLQRYYINLSAIALVAGALAITAIEAGTPLSSPIVKFCALIAAPILVATTADAALRFYRSAWAWMPINRGRGLFRLTWVLAALLGIGMTVGATSLILTA
ncbi:MAG: hypothetical protein ABIZ52_08460 [Candidatus Limnocylindrales bacterium]